MTETRTKLAVLGLGTMGRGIASSVLRAAIPLVVWNRNPESANGFAERGAEVAPTAADAVSGVDVVITMVTDAEAIRSIAIDLGVLESLRSDAVWVQMSTIGVAATEAMANLVKQRRPDVVFLDAPVSGSKVPAEQGKLIIFASGSEQVRPRVEPIFAAIGQRTIWLGRVGAGSRMKLVNNTLLAFGAEGVTNSLVLAHRLGLSPSLVLEAFEGGPLLSPWEAGKIRRIEAGDYSPEFPLRLALKDVLLALGEGGADQFAVLAALAQEWTQIVAEGLGDEDVTVVARALGA